MDPIAGQAILSGVTGIAQFFNSEKARGAAQSELNDLKAIYDNIKPPGYNVAIDAPPEVHQNTLALPQFANQLQAPQFNLSQLSPQQQSMVGQLIPQYAQYVQENAPQTLNKSSDFLTGKQAQLNALNRYTQIGEGEFDPKYQQAVTQANQSAQQQANSANQSILQDAARRGVQNSGLVSANQQAATGQAMNSLASSNMGAASQAYQNRLNALSQGSNIGQNLQNTDINMQSQNANIINQFNQRMQQQQQNVENQRATTSNMAQQYNLGVNQGIANQNVNQANNFAVGQQNRGDTLAQQNFNAQVGQQGVANTNAQQQYQNQSGQLGFNNNIASQLANWNAQQRAVQNQLATNNYQNQMQSAGAQSGLTNAQMGQTIGRAQDINNAIQGVGNMGTSAMMSYNNQNQAQQNQYAKANQMNYQNTGNWMDQNQAQQYKDSMSYY